MKDSLIKAVLLGLIIIAVVIAGQCERKRAEIRHIRYEECVAEGKMTPINCSLWVQFSEGDE